jgi:DNA-binding response OmpR family regulator
MVNGILALVREDEAATDAVEITHYLRIYGELISFQRHLLERTGGAARNGREPGPDQLDAQELRREIQDLEARLEFWEQRLAAARAMAIDEERRLLLHRDRTVSLTRREIQLLQCLLRSPDTYLTSRRLVAAAWADERLAPEQVRTYIVRLRRKLAECGAACRIVSMPRLGYRLEFDAPAFDGTALATGVTADSAI